MRLFIAINFNNEVRSRLLTLRDELCGKSQRGRFTAPENLHLTLAFLGECDNKQTAVVKSVLNTVSFEPFDIAVDCVGRFKRSVVSASRKPLTSFAPDFFPVHDDSSLRRASGHDKRQRSHAVHKRAIQEYRNRLAGIQRFKRCDYLPVPWYSRTACSAKYPCKLHKSGLQRHGLYIR